MGLLKKSEDGGEKGKKKEKEDKKDKEEKKEKKDDKQDNASQTTVNSTTSKSIEDLANVDPSEVEQVLNREEKRFLLYVERGDTASVQHILKKANKDNKKKKGSFNIDCLDPLGRSALIISIENENYDLIEELLRSGISPGDALLHAIAEEYVEGVSLLIDHEERVHIPGNPYSWESIKKERATFTPDITPLILAAHKNNYEILKLLLDRGATLPMPHDIKCSCDDCLFSSDMDSLRHSLSRINAYKALASPSLIALSSKDPIATAISLSAELKKLASMENEFRQEYKNLRIQVQDFSSDLINNARTSYEIEILLNYSENGPPHTPGEHMKLLRLRDAVDKKQKQFVSHANVQQLLSDVWYDGMPGFKRMNSVNQLTEVAKIGAMFPVYSCAYIFAPDSKMGVQITKPFVKFIVHSSSYFFFLLLLVMVSQRVEALAIDLFGTESMVKNLRRQEHEARGALPTYVEMLIVVYVFGFIFKEMRCLWVNGISDYIKDLWNFIDFTINFLYMNWFILRLTAWFQTKREMWYGLDPYVPKEDWDPFDPMLISEGMFGAANIFSFLKLVHIFSVNPHLGPLQISLGRMIIDIIKFFFIYSLVLFAFGCGLNNLLWYYADIDKQRCYSWPGGLKNPMMGRSCGMWRRFSNLFETAQSLFWASFGIVDLSNFELTGIKPFTRFWAMLMFGSYNVINVIVLLNLLIAMMSNSYSMITERSDLEWKFARSKLWMSYFEEGQEVPSPFNLIPNIRSIVRALPGKGKEPDQKQEEEDKRRDAQYAKITRNLIRRYVTEIQRRYDETEVTEDDMNEIKQSISSCKYEVLNILRINGWQTKDRHVNKDNPMGRKQQTRERRLKKGFNIGMVEGLDLNSIVVKGRKGPVEVISNLVLNAWSNKDVSKKEWSKEMTKATKDPIGSSTSLNNRASLREARSTRWKKVQYFQRQGVFMGGEINETVLSQTQKKCKNAKSWGRLRNMKETGRLTYNYQKHAEEMRKNMEESEAMDDSWTPSPSPLSLTPTPSANPTPTPYDEPKPIPKLPNKEASQDSQKPSSSLAPSAAKKAPQPPKKTDPPKSTAPKPPPKPTASKRTESPKPPPKPAGSKPAEPPKPPPKPASSKATKAPEEPPKPASSKATKPPEELPKPAASKPTEPPKPSPKPADPKSTDTPQAPAAPKPAAVEPADSTKASSRATTPEPNLVAGVSAVTKQKRTGWL